jgi:hypothetical protein
MHRALKAVDIDRRERTNASGRAFIEQAFDSCLCNGWGPMASKDRPGPAFLALRAAALGIDDHSRRALRAWAMDALDHRGDVQLGHAGPDDDGARVIVAGILALDSRERSAYRLWLGRWTDYSGRIITPSEQQRRREDLMSARENHIEKEPRGGRP